MVCYNCGVLGHYDRDFPEPMNTCSYCRQEHNVEQFPQLITRWQALTVGEANLAPNPTSNSPNPNANTNRQMIVVEPWEPSVALITRGGVVMGADQAMPTEPTVQAQPQVRPTAQNKASLVVQEQKHVFMDVCPELVET